MKLFSSYKFKFILAVVALIFVVVLVIAFASIQLIEMNAIEVFHERSQIAMEQAAQFMDVEKIKELSVTLDDQDPYYIETCGSLWDVRVTHGCNYIYAMVPVPGTKNDFVYVLDGFADVPGTRIIVFYPHNGVSAMQKLQMTTQEGSNVAVCAIEGNFDDAQTGVKNIFADEEMKAFLAAENMEFSSANSINFGRLAPQIIYYVSAYCDLVRSGRIRKGESFNVTVPTGNFGNILAAVYAREMGIPIRKFICASNKNNILTDFINTGCYDRNRPFYTTTSPSMDILISSNLERMLYLLYGNDAAAVADLMKQLKEQGRYEVSKEVLAKLQDQFFGGYCDDEATRNTIAELFKENNYLCDTHTAVAVNVYKQYVKATGDKTPTVIASTASPYKFASAVLPAVCDEALPEDEFGMVEKLSAVTGTAIPVPLATLKDRKVLHTSKVDKNSMIGFIKNFLG